MATVFMAGFMRCLACHGMAGGRAGERVGGACRARGAAFVGGDARDGAGRWRVCRSRSRGQRAVRSRAWGAGWNGGGGAWGQGDAWAEQGGDARDGAGGTARVSEQRGSEHSVGRGVGGGRWAAVGSDQVAGTRRGGRAGGVGGGGDAVVVGGSRCTRPSGSPAHGARGFITPEPTSAPSRPPCPCLLVGLDRRRRVIGRQAGGRAAGAAGAPTFPAAPRPALALAARPPY